MRVAALAAATWTCLAAALVQATEIVSISQSWGERRGAPFAAADLLGVTDLGGVATAADGVHVAFVSRIADANCNCYHHTLHLLDRRSRDVHAVADLGPPFLYRLPDGSIIGSLMTPQPEWSTDGRFLAFFVKRDDHARLHVYEPKTGITREVDTAGREPFAFVWSGAPETIIYETADANPDAARAIEQGNASGFLYGPEFIGVQAGRLPGTPRIPIHLYGDGTLFGSPKAAVTQLRTFSLKTGHIGPVSDPDRAFFQNNAESAAYQSRILKNAGVVYSGNREFSLSLEPADPGYIRRAILSDMRHSPAPSKGVEGNCKDIVAEAYWSEAAHKFVLVCAPSAVWLGSVGHFLLLDPVTGEGRPWFDLHATGIFDGSMGATCSISGLGMVCVEELPSSPPRLISIGPHGRRSTLFDPNRNLRSRHFGRIERLRWRNAMGIETWADLVYPAGYRLGSQYPLVVVQYNSTGFLRGGTGNEYPIFPLAEARMFVLSFRHPAEAPEERGIANDRRTKAAWAHNKVFASTQSSLDIVIADLIARGLVDPHKIAYTGLSAGANQIDYALANGRRMAAAISSTCCIGPEQWPLMAASLMLAKDMEIVGWANPATDPNYRESWAPVSPSLNVKNIQTAFLANSSESEMLGAHALWLLMRHFHRPMEQYVYAGEYHIKSQPLRRSAIYSRNIAWLRFWLQNYEDIEIDRHGEYDRWRAMRDESSKLGRVQPGSNL